MRLPTKLLTNETLTKFCDVAYHGHDTETVVGVLGLMKSDDIGTHQTPPDLLRDVIPTGAQCFLRGGDTLLGKSLIFFLNVGRHTQVYDG